MFWQNVFTAKSCVAHGAGKGFFSSMNSDVSFCISQSLYLQKAKWALIFLTSQIYRIITILLHLLQAKIRKKTLTRSKQTAAFLGQLLMMPFQKMIFQSLFPSKTRLTKEAIERFLIRMNHHVPLHISSARHLRNAKWTSIPNDGSGRTWDFYWFGIKLQDTTR